MHQVSAKIICSMFYPCNFGSGLIKTNTGEPLINRLHSLHTGLSSVLKKFNPQISVLEKIFVNKNPGSSLNFAYARGVILLALATYGQKLQEVSPNSVKKIITGNGHATKEQVKYMVQNTLKVKLDKVGFDVYDALGLGICAKCGDFS